MQSSSPTNAEETELEKALRDKAQEIYRLGNLEELTIKRIRSAVELELGLYEGYFKQETWKDKSKRIIESEVELISAGREQSSTQSPASPKVLKKLPKAASSAQTTKRRKIADSDDEIFNDGTPSPGLPKILSKGVQSKKAQRGAVSVEDVFSAGAPALKVLKRPRKVRAAPAQPTKRRKKGETNEECFSDDAESICPVTKVEEFPSRTVSRISIKGNEKEVTEAGNALGKDPMPNDAAAPDSESEMSTVTDEPPKPKRKGQDSGLGKSDANNSSRSKAIKETEKFEDSDAGTKGSKLSEVACPESGSEMSIVIDGPPKRKSKGQGSGSGKSASKNSGSSRTSRKTEQTADPDTEEIKRLQGWLVKCGCRKMWYKELAPYGTPKLKIKHLKNMLSELGMTGRFSAEKASKIREERELKADLESVQEGEKLWGKENSEEEASAKPRRRLARGFKELDFLNSDDGAETD